jgi:hypothetical protein
MTSIFRSFRIQAGATRSGEHVAGTTEVPCRPIVSVGKFAIGLTAMLAFSAVAQTHFVPSPESIVYDTGVMPGVAISGTSVVEVHQGSANGFGPLWYRSGRIQADGTVFWNRSYQYDNGGRPSVAVSGVNVVEVHEGTANGFGPLWYRTGEIQPDGTVGWSDSHPYDNGARPSVAVSGNNVIEVHQGSGDGFGLLWYKTGQLKADGSVVWADDGHPYDYGGAPRIAASGPNIIEVHQGSGNNFGALWYKTAELKTDGTVVWADAGYYYDSGGAPSVSLTGATILEVHQGSANSPGPLWFHAGHIQPDGSVVWNAAGSQYDTGANPSIALSGAVALEVHQAGIGFGFNYYRSLRY